MPDAGSTMDTATPPPAVAGVVRFGSFVLALDADDPFWAAILPRRFRTSLQAAADLTPDAIVTIRHVETAAVRERVLAVIRDGDRVRIDSDVMSLDGDWSASPVRVVIRVDRRDADAAWLEHCFAVMLHKILHLCGVVRLHAAAVAIDGRTHVFAGDKGAGKSTLALALGRAGGRVLADDQIVIRRRDDRYVVSGADGMVRLTAASERHFFAAPLPLPAADFGGVLKKEVPLRDLAIAAPFEDWRADRIFFPFVGERLGVRPLSRQAAALRILDAVAISHGFAAGPDRLAFLTFVTTFVAGLECATLELSPDLRDLDRLRVALCA